jgi:hypothetical protein
LRRISAAMRRAAIVSIVIDRDRLRPSHLYSPAAFPPTNFLCDF